MPAPRAFPPRDPTAALRAARSFYRSRALHEWVAALPRSAKTRVPRTPGLDSAWLFPPVPVQVATVTLLFETLSTRPVKRLSEEQQYGEPLISDLHTLRLCSPRQRPVGPYLLLFRGRGVPPESLGKAPSAVEHEFHASGWTGLTIPEYLVLQRVGAEAWRDHRFDAADTRAGPQAQWLLDAGAPNECTSAQWNPVPGRVEVRFTQRDHGEPGRGAHPSVVVPL